MLWPAIAGIAAIARLDRGNDSDATRIAVDEMNEAVLQAIEEHALTPEAIEQVVALTERDDHRERQRALEAEARDINRRIARLVAAVEDGGPVGSLVAKLRELEARRDSIARERGATQPVPRLEPVVVEGRLAEWRRLLRGSTTQARAVLQRVLRGRATFTPNADGSGYDFAGPTRFDKLFSGVACPRPSWMPRDDRTGLDDIDIDDTPDVDYGRLLERVFDGKGVSSPAGTAHGWPMALRGFYDRMAA